MPLTDLSNAGAGAASTARTPYKADRFAGFVIPSLTAPPPGVAKAGAGLGSGKTQRAPAKPRAVAAATTTKRKAPVVVKKEVAAAAAASTAAVAVQFQVTTPTTTASPADRERTPSAHPTTGEEEQDACALVEGFGVSASAEVSAIDIALAGAASMDGVCDARTPEPRQYGSYGDAATPAPVMMGETPLAAYLAPEGTPFAFAGAYTPYDTGGRGGFGARATPYASARSSNPTPNRTPGEDDEDYDDEPSMMIPRIRTTSAAHRAAYSSEPQRLSQSGLERDKHQQEGEEEEEEEPLSSIPHAQHGARAATEATGDAAAGGRCLSREAAGLLSGREATVKDVEEAGEAGGAGRDGRKRSSRRATIAPARYGEFLSWDNVKALGTPGHGLKTGEGGGGGGDVNERDAGDVGDEDFKENDEENDDHFHHHHRNTRSSGAASGSRACSMGNGDNGATCPIPSLRFGPGPGISDPTVQEVHDKVSALMRMAADLLPSGEDEAEDGGGGRRKGGKKGGRGAGAAMEGKSLREKLSDAWDGKSYYAQLAAQMQSPSPDPGKRQIAELSPTTALTSKGEKSKESLWTAAATAAARRGGGGGAAAARKTAKAPVGSRRKSVMPPFPSTSVSAAASAVTRETASSLAKVTTRRRSLGGAAATALREVQEKEDKESSPAKQASPKSKLSAAATAAAAAAASIISPAAAGVTKRKRKSVGKTAAAALAALMAEGARASTAAGKVDASPGGGRGQEQRVGWMTQTNALFTDDGAERRSAPSAAATPAASSIATPAAAPAATPAATPAIAIAVMGTTTPSAVAAETAAAAAAAIHDKVSLERQMALLRAELAMTKSDLESAQSEIESLRADGREAETNRAELAMAKSDLESAQREIESLRADGRKAETEAALLRAAMTSQAEELRIKDAEVERQGRVAVGQVAAAYKAQLLASLDALEVVEAEALEGFGNAAGRQ
jgi:hypothetical protein